MEELEKLTKKERFEKSNIELKLSHIHRYGVFAAKDISPKEVIEECPVIIFRPLNLEYREEISNREFFWDDNDSAIALGYGSMYNHANEPNAAYSIDRCNQVLKFIATKYIESGTEILVNYGDNWFALRNNKSVTAEEVMAQQKKKNDFGLFKVFALLFALLVLSMVFPINLSSPLSF